MTLVKNWFFLYQRKLDYPLARAKSIRIFGGRDMRKLATGLSLVCFVLALASPVTAQDYRARVQGSIVDTS